MGPATGNGAEAALEGWTLFVGLMEPEAVLWHACVLCKMLKVSKLPSPKIALSPKGRSGTKSLSHFPTQVET